jgi:hypothetical protein
MSHLQQKVAVKQRNEGASLIRSLKQGGVNWTRVEDRPTQRGQGGLGNGIKRTGVSKWFNHRFSVVKDKLKLHRIFPPLHLSLCLAGCFSAIVPLGMDLFRKGDVLERVNDGSTFEVSGMDGKYVRYRRDASGATRSLHQREILLGVRSGEFRITCPEGGSWSAPAGDPEIWLQQVRRGAGNKAGGSSREAAGPSAGTSRSKSNRRPVSRKSA